MNEQRAGNEVPEMVKVSIEVSSGTARFRVAVQAESVQRGLGLVVGRYPTGSCRVKFPIEAEKVSVQRLTPEAGLQPKKLAA